MSTKTKKSAAVKAPKTYTKKHYSGKAIASHIRKIKKRGGQVTEKDMTVIYTFKK